MTVVCFVRNGNCGTPGGRALRNVDRTRSVGCDHWARRVQEPPNPYKPVRLNHQIATACFASLAMTNRVAFCVIARRAQPDVAAQPLAALPPYGCGVPLAGACPAIRRSKTLCTARSPGMPPVSCRLIFLNRRLRRTFSHFNLRMIAFSAAIWHDEGTKRRQ